MVDPVNIVTDGNLSFRGGQNAGILPDRIGEDQYAAGINVTTEDGGLGPRPGFVHQEIEVVTEGGVENSLGDVIPYTEIFKSGKFQGAAPYDVDNTQGILAVISGIIFVIIPSLGTAEALEIEEQESEISSLEQLLEPSSQRLDQYCNRFSINSAGRFYVIHDFPDTPIIIEGGEARRADPDNTFPDGTPNPELIASVLGAYNQSRYFFSSAVHEFTAGDPVGNPLTPEAPVTIQEIATVAAPFNGQVFSLGSTNQNKPITAMGFTQVTDSSTGLGPLFVATKDSIYTFRTDLPRTQWEQTQFGRLLLFNAGIAGPRAFVNVNTDLHFISGDGGIRTLAISVTEQRKFSNTPIDREIENWNVADDPDLFQFSVAETVGNRVFFTVDPFRIDAQDLDRNPTVDYAFGGLAVLELDNISGLLTDAQPIWTGLWQGINPMDLVISDGEMYVFSKDPGSVNNLYKLEESINHDVFKGTKRLITSRMYSREYAFQNRFSLKEERSVEPTLSNIRGETSVIIDRKVDAGTRWLRWREWKHNAIVDECGDVGCDERPVLVEQNFRDINFGSPEVNASDPVTKEDLRYFKRSQFRLTIKGENWKLLSFVARAELQPDANLIHGPCEELESRVEKDCEDISDWNIHSAPFTGDDECPQVDQN